MREKICINDNWKFHYGDIISVRNRWAWGKSGSWNQGPESAGFDDTSWEDVTLPHDFVIKTEPYEYTKQEFNDADNAIPLMEDVGNIHTTAGSFAKNAGWYRKRFSLNKTDIGRRIYLVFDGVYRDMSLYLNEFYIGSHKSGYTGVTFDITDFVLYDDENILSVKTDAREAEGWFYEGGGIYRSVWILKTSPAHIKDVFADYTLDIDTKVASLNFKTEFENPNNEALSVTHYIINQNGDTVKTMTKNGDISKVLGTMENVHLWDIDNTYLYTVKTELISNGVVIDSYTVPLGFRTIEFSENGFYLNGKKTKIKGVCNHQNHGGIGTALTSEIFNYRIQKLKEMGANAYRCAHYWQGEAVLDACDRYGLMVMSENRLFQSADDDLTQLEFVVRNSRNHPSVILYSIGNEEAQSQTSKQSGRIAKTMVNTVKRLDSTRPVTMALLMWDLKHKKPLESVDMIMGIANEIDVAGFNYHDYRWEEFHNKKPHQPMIATEQDAIHSTRGIMKTDRALCHLALNDTDDVKHLAGVGQWQKTDSTDYVCGTFIWTGFDYYGEPTPYAWPAISSQFGVMDLCGYKKDTYYYYKSWWDNNTDTVHICTHWNLDEGTVENVHIFSNCDTVELFVNEKSCGKLEILKNGYALFENVKFEKGKISAIGYKNGIAVCKDEVKTADVPYRVKLSVDYEENDIFIIKAQINDCNGNTVPYADNEMLIDTPDAIFLGASNGDPSDHTLVTSKKRKAFCGLAQFIIKGKKGTKIAVTSNGIIGDDIII
ncbi:MAG: DUF4982 domain-containing protein [Clostridia bacterium]|nr:DUF4982 domain-containing protein [Clostridia bacterium]